jgi:hypothetical protein
MVSLPEELKTKLQSIVKMYSEALQEKAQKLGVPILHFPILRPHNIIIALDNKKMHVVLDLKHATRGMTHSQFANHRNKVIWEPESLVAACKRELGYTETYYFSFPSEFLTLPQEELKQRIDEVADGEVKAVYTRLALLQQSGLGEAFGYLRNAQLRLSSGEPTGFADCKSNCRNALLSAIKAITGQENIREGIKIMRKQGYFGKREEEFFEALEDICSAVYQIQSKKGPHPPMPVQLESEFTFRLTEATIDFLEKCKIAKMQT